MSKFFKLYVNENIKILKKKSTIVFLIIIVISLAAALGLTYIIKSSYANSSTDSYWKNVAKQDVEHYKKQLDSSSENKSENQAKVEVYQYAIDHDINYIFSGSNGSQYWKDTVIETLVSKVTALNEAKQNANVDTKDMQSEIDDLYSMLNNNDFDKYADSIIANYNKMYEAGSISKEEKDIYIEIENIDKKYKINANYENDKIDKSSLLREIQNSKVSLLKGINISTSKSLSSKDIQDLNDKIKIDMYKIENNIESISSNSISGSNINYRNLYENIAQKFSMLLLGLFVLVVAGGSIAAEFSKGTIKSLIMVPCKRWKILLSKILTYTVILLVSTVVISLLTYAVGNIFFSSEQASPYVYVQNDNIQAIGHLKYTILNFLTYDIDIFIYMLFAVMLSTVTKNVAASVGVGIFVYVGNSIIMEIINSLTTKEWIKFIPFNNMNLSSKIFKYSSNAFENFNVTNSVVSNISVKFSLCVLLVCAILMIVTMFDSFNKKEIVT